MVLALFLNKKSISIFMNTAETVLQDLESRAEVEGIPFVGPEKGRVLVELVKSHKPERILEVGTNVGYSSILMANAAPGERVEIVTLEIDPETAGQARENIEKAHLSHLINVVIGDAKLIIPALPGPFDMVFLDAVKEEYLDYLKKAEDQLSIGAVVVADNVGIFALTLQNYLDYVRQSDKYDSQVYDFGYDAMEVSRLK
jgi:predicted O-methyltransferase YrrM